MSTFDRAAANELAAAPWRKSSFSGDNGGECVELAPLASARVAVRNSKLPEAGTVLFSRAELAAWLSGCKAGEFDDLT